MAHAVWTPLAEDDLEEILFQIRVVDKRPLTARRNGKAIHDAVNSRANMEVPGQIHSAAPPGWLYFRFKRWLIFFDHIPKESRSCESSMEPGICPSILARPR